MAGPLKAVNEDAPWVEKYRPKSLGDVAAHKDIIDTIKRLLNENRLPHLLFYGPPGTGKTSTILAMARQMYGSSMASLTLELNASDDRGIAVVRQQIQDFVSTRTIFSTMFKLVILDECDAMTRDAQFALRRVIEKYTRNARFCLICNYVSKIIPALQSRCTRFRFSPLNPSFVKTRLDEVAKCERLEVSSDGLDALVKLGAGDMRRTLNIFQSTAMASSEVTEEAIYLCTGNPHPSDIKGCLKDLLSQPFAAAYKSIGQLQAQKGLALLDIVEELHPLVFRLSMPSDVRCNLVEQLADIEYRLGFGTSEKLQLGALVSAFVTAREGITAYAEKTGADLLDFRGEVRLLNG